MKKQKILVSALLIGTLLGTSVSASAISNKVTASGHSVKTSSYGTKYGYGYVTSDSMHTTTVKIICPQTGDQESGSDYGTGRVSAETPGIVHRNGQTYNTAVFYNFD